jgi:hypothetical protein
VVIEYLGNHAAEYGRLYKLAQAGQSDRQTARKIFGQRAIARSLKIPQGSRKLIKNCTAWSKIASELKIDVKPARRPRTKIGLAMALEEHADQSGDPVVDEASRHEVEEKLVEAIASSEFPNQKQAFEDLLAKFRAGEYTDEEATAIFKMAQSQYRYSRPKSQRKT